MATSMRKVSAPAALKLWQLDRIDEVAHKPGQPKVADFVHRTLKLSSESSDVVAACTEYVEHRFAEGRLCQERSALVFLSFGSAAELLLQESDRQLVKEAAKHKMVCFVKGQIVQPSGGAVAYDESDSASQYEIKVDMTAKEVIQAVKRAVQRVKDENLPLRALVIVDILNAPKVRPCLVNMMHHYVNELSGGRVAFCFLRDRYEHPSDGNMEEIMSLWARECKKDFTRIAPSSASIPLTAAVHINSDIAGASAERAKPSTRQLSKQEEEFQLKQFLTAQATRMNDFLVPLDKVVPLSAELIVSRGNIFLMHEMFFEEICTTFGTTFFKFTMLIEDNPDGTPNPDKWVLRGTPPEVSAFQKFRGATRHPFVYIHGLPRKSCEVFTDKRARFPDVVGDLARMGGFVIYQRKNESTPSSDTKAQATAESQYHIHLKRE
eukprot:m.307661 g.307661  ORF g.307661 m.307661 type:complete len:436 (-) comp20246_c0_seq1:155-1462(-)